MPTDPALQVSASKSQASRYHEIILQKLEKGQQARSIFQDLVIEQDYSGSYDSIKRYVRQLKKRSPKLYARIETPPGEEAQVDFGEGAPVLNNGRYRKPWLFVMTLSCSRKSYEEVVWRQDVETFLHCHENAFRFFGGVPKTIKVDNLKSAVLKAHLYEPDLNPIYLAFSKHWDFIPLPCQVATPEHKGKVESGIKYVQNNALKGKRFSSLDEQNSHLRFWNKRWASTRIHGTTKQQVAKMFQEERPLLQPLPNEPFQFFKIGVRIVNIIDSHIEVNGAYYPIPPSYMGKKVVVHYNSAYVKAFYQGKQIQMLSAIAKGRFHPDKSCLPENKNFDQLRYLQSLFAKCEELGPSVFKWAKEAESLRKQTAYRSIRGVIALNKRFSPEIINWACQQAISINGFSYKVVQQMTEARVAQLESQHELQLEQGGELIRSPQSYEELLKGVD